MRKAIAILHLHNKLIHTAIFSWVTQSYDSLFSPVNSF